MKKPTPATITLARFHASGSFVQHDDPDAFSVFCGELHLPLLCVLAQRHQCKINKVIKKAESAVGLQHGFPGEVGEAEDADQTAGRQRPHLPPPP